MLKCVEYHSHQNATPTIQYNILNCTKYLKQSAQLHQISNTKCSIAPNI